MSAKQAEGHSEDAECDLTRGALEVGANPANLAKTKRNMIGDICTALGIAGVHGLKFETRCLQNKPMATLKMRNVIFSSRSNYWCPRNWGKPSE